MIEEETIENLRIKFSHVHPLMFARSVERANTAGELFDILSEIPENPPFVWNENIKRWETTNDLSQFEDFEVEWK